VSIQIANALVQRLGPCVIQIDQAAHPELACELALMGCDITEPGTRSSSPSSIRAGYLAWTGPGAGPRFASAITPFAQAGTLALHSAGQPREALEAQLFAHGWRRHPASMMLHEYGAWTADCLPALTYWQHDSGQRDGWLDRGFDADAMIARCAMAATHVRTGDRVLIDGAGSDDAAAIILALSRAGTVLLVGGVGDSRWETTGPALDAVPAQSIDLVVAFDAETPEGWQSRVADYARLLKPDGRAVLGWQRDRGDGARPRDWDAMDDTVSEWLLPELRYAQCPASPDARGPQMMLQTPAEQAADVEWLIMVASANPLLGADATLEYENPAYPLRHGTPPALVDFGSAYDNPWLYRSLVQMGERLNHEVKLARLAECVIEDSRPDSADRGAAIAVLGYRILEMRRADLAGVILPPIEAYVDQPVTPETPVHVLRWRISLSFLAGRLCEMSEKREDAAHWYRQAAEANWWDFSPLLATKSIAAAFYEARLHLAAGNAQTALACFRQGMETSLKAAASAHDAQMGPDGHPLPFYLQELAEVIDMGSQCANALAHFHLWQRDPGLFWRQVDVRRFGLASWARDLEHENQRLRAA